MKVSLSPTSLLNFVLQSMSRTAIRETNRLGKLLAVDEDDLVAPALANTQKPLWEVGIGVVAGAIPDYPGSDRYQIRGLPLPYFIYRGNVLRSDQSGTRLRAASGIVEWEFGGGGTLR